MCAATQLKERKKRSGVWVEIDSSGEFFQHQNFPRLTFPVAHAGSEQDLCPEAKESVGVGQRVLNWVAIGGVTFGEDCGPILESLFGGVLCVRTKIINS